MLRTRPKLHLSGRIVLRPLALGLLAPSVLLLAGCWNLGEGYGQPCESNGDCPGVLLNCHDVPREGKRLCLTRAPGPEGQRCVDALECNQGLRCDLATATCAGGGIGLPECGADEDCDAGLRCISGSCVAPEEAEGG